MRHCVRTLLRMVIPGYKPWYTRFFPSTISCSHDYSRMRSLNLMIITEYRLRHTRLFMMGTNSMPTQHVPLFKCPHGGYGASPPPPPPTHTHTHSRCHATVHYCAIVGVRYCA